MTGPNGAGFHRDGIWRETGVLQSIPLEGPKVLWRVPIGTGFSSPVVAQDRVFVTDSRVTRTNVRENVHCFDAATGKAIWTHTSDVVYPEYGADPAHPFGPAATPVVADGKVYTLGRMSHLLCLDAIAGRARWSHDLPKEYNTTEDLRGFNSSPIIESNLLIIVVAKVRKSRSSPSTKIRAGRFGKRSMKFRRTLRQSSSRPRGAGN